MSAKLPFSHTQRPRLRDYQKNMSKFASKSYSTRYNYLNQPSPQGNFQRHVTIATEFKIKLLLRLVKGGGGGGEASFFFFFFFLVSDVA